MAEVKISDLTSATTPLAGTEVVPIVQGGITKKVAVSNFSGSSSGIVGVHNVLNYFDLTSQGISAQLNSQGTSNVAMSANQMYAYPFIPNKTITSVSLKINVSVLGVGVNARILIYSDSNGTPTTKLYESANLDCSTTGIKTATTAQTFNAGTVYWLCVQSSGTTSISGIPAAALLPLQMTSTLTAAPTTAYINTSTFGSAPTTFAINQRSNSAAPLVGIYLS